MLLMLGLGVNSAFAQGVIFSTVDESPKTLVLETVVPYAGEAKVYHMHDEPLSMVEVNFSKFSGLKEHIKNVRARNTYCDGDFSLEYDDKGKQFIKVNAIDVCIDSEGWPVAHSLGRRLTQEQLQDKILKLTRRVQQNRVEPAIYDGYEDLDDELIGPANSKSGQEAVNN